MDIIVKRLLVVCVIIAVVNSCNSNHTSKMNRITDDLRYESIIMDTTLFLPVYKNIMLSGPISSVDDMFVDDTTVWDATNTHNYRVREAKLYEKIGNMYEVYKIFGYKSEVDYYGLSNIKYENPTVYNRIQEYLADEPSYGSLEIDKLLEKSPRVGSLVVGIVNEGQISEYVKLTGWFACEEDNGNISNVTCVFDEFALTPTECDKIAKSIIYSLSSKYGCQYEWTMSGYGYNHEVAWLSGKYEVHFCTRKGQQYDSEKSSYEFIIQYIDNESVLRKKEEQKKLQLEKELEDSINKSELQKRLQDEYNNMTI